MCENAVSTINEIVGAALSAAQAKYGYQESLDGFTIKSMEPHKSQADIFVNSEAPDSDAESRHRVKLPDGTYASVNVSIPGL